MNSVPRALMAGLFLRSVPIEILSFVGTMAMSSLAAHAAPSTEKFDEYAPSMRETFSSKSSSLNGPSFGRFR